MTSPRTGRTRPPRSSCASCTGSRPPETGGDWPTTPRTDLVGLIIPARNYALPTIGYVGVVPKQRGHGYVNDLLAEMAWRLDELAPGEELGADTDVGNGPMARAFARAGFRNVAARMVMTERGMG